MSEHRWQCIDAGSDYCPCYLAETMDCITCSHLQEKEFCDCDWRGVCIYQAFTFEGHKKKNPRGDIRAEITEREELGDRLIVFTLKVPHTLARQVNQPGSYIFIRNENFGQYFDIPISVMSVDSRRDYIKIAVEIHGVKTKTIKSADNYMLIRGPYWNGVFGLEYLKQTQNTNCLIIARGIAQAPAILVIHYLLRNNNNIDLILDRGSINYNFIEEYCDINSTIECNLYESEGTKALEKQLDTKTYGVVFLGGSDYLKSRLFSSIEKLEGMNVVRTNNNELCCGEGICGSCTMYDINGIPIRTCKTQIVKSQS
ncbi:sulfide/dihydroorotate dehydrogenase-like FAD/NAD-binding protein [Natronincola ferrireducens]|uniref:NAD(P)H-flavin reductase n=1 Tax=Natronincola ferrireducens TaxID=393762 RepID=A0A1G9CDC9_9FIRM|nr:sulfide/dihydroorotate dehydrogenase-like FAD/NAD-binding protein [Natronincola ferrireducens]SDK49669.1 NAD(P)H-flavin reductase [Natronincola ferrireducens]